MSESAFCAGCGAQLLAAWRQDDGYHCPTCGTVTAHVTVQPTGWNADTAPAVKAPATIGGHSQGRLFVIAAVAVVVAMFAFAAIRIALI